MEALRERFGKYHVLEKIAQGGMAEVYKVKTVGIAGFEKIQALKRILPSSAREGRFIRSFIDEARIAVELTHRNIVQVFDFGKADGELFLAMELIEGKDLRSALGYIKRIEAGLVRVNGDTTGVDPHAPFGGMKGSSSGSREQGPLRRLPTGDPRSRPAQRPRRRDFVWQRRRLGDRASHHRRAASVRLRSGESRAYPCVGRGPDRRSRLEHYARLGSCLRRSTIRA